MNIAHMFSEDFLRQMLRDLENADYHLYYDEKLDQWETCSDELDFYITNKSKMQVLHLTWRKIKGL